MRKGRDGENGGGEKKSEKKKITAEIVATTSLPVDRLTATDCNAAARANLFHMEYKLPNSSEWFWFCLVITILLLK